ncbi:sulfurtransferase [Paenibacillus sp. FSL K6-1096]|uniref:sulfurtransferase n=1 Tax=Paenibacillus sp. FSL K6-1096 TaxID=2921460 RepID=UPI0030EB2007
MDSTVTKRWLLARLYEPEQTIVDCRFNLNDPGEGRALYEAGHIPGAVYLDLKLDLSAPEAEHGGRHPLPDPEVFAARFSKLGISNSTRVVAYDDESGMNAARLWWLLRYLGHEQVFILEGGFSQWKAEKYPVTDHQPVRVPSSFTPNVQPQMLAGVDDVRLVSEKLVQARAGEGTSTEILIDSRAGDRFRGMNETMDKKAGHVPGAVNFFWKDTQNADGSFKSAEELAEHFAGLDKEAEIIVYCGSGVTACPNILALEKAGFKNVRLYAGSWSDWISYEENAIATGNE